MSEQNQRTPNARSETHSITKPSFLFEFRKFSSLALTVSEVRKNDEGKLCQGSNRKHQCTKVKLRG